MISLIVVIDPDCRISMILSIPYVQRYSFKATSPMPYLQRHTFDAGPRNIITDSTSS